MTVVAGTPTEAAAAVDSPLAPSRTPRPTFQLTRRLVGVPKWPLILLTAVYAVNVSDQYIVPTLFPLLKQEFGLSDTALGALSGSYLVVVTLGTVPFGILADRRRRTRIIAWGTAAWGLTMIWTGLARNYASLLASRMVLGAWDPCDNPTSQSLLADYYPVRQRTKVMSVYQIGSICGIFAVPIAAAMAEEWGWRSAMFFFSIPAFIVAVLAWRLPEPVRGEMDRRYGNIEGGITIPSVYDEMPARQAYGHILRIPTYTSMLVSNGVGALFFGGSGAWLATFLVRYHDMTLSQAATATLVFALGGLIGALSSGQIADYLAFKGMRSARLAVAGVGRVATVPLLLVAFSVPNVGVMLVLFTIGVVTMVAPVPPINAARADVLHPSLRGRGTSLDAVVQALCGAASPILFGILADVFSLRSAFLILAPAIGIAGLINLAVSLPAYNRDERRMREQLVEEARAAGPHVIAAEASHTVEPDPDTILQIEGVDLSYGPIQVLFDVSAAVPRGGCHALVGRNGVGKTTLLNCIAGLIEPQSGRILYDGVDLVGVPPEQRVKLGITLMAGGRSTFPSLSVLDNLWLGTYTHAGDDKLFRQRLDAVLHVFPALANRLGQQGGTLSGGEQQMMALARSLMAGPRLLLVDELSLGLAPLVTRELLGVVRRIRDLGTTVVIVEQSVPVAMEVADTVLFMEKGEVRELGPAEPLRDGEHLVQLMMSGGAP
jgi:ABC-type branched-subunit amino acid transport system ATPase component/sugar phosphate permease